MYVINKKNDITFFIFMLINYICYKETWILFRGYQSGVSKLIRDAYHYYGVMEFEKKKHGNTDK